MKGLFVFSVAAVAASSWSVFDLQKVSRFNSASLVDSSLQFVIPKPDGGFVAAGRAHEDIYVIEFDAFGSVLRTALWDSPLVLNDQLVYAGRYADGRILLGTVASGSRAMMVQLSPSFTVNWEVQKFLTTPQFALDGSGNAYISGGLGVESFSDLGVSKGLAAITNFELSAMMGIPGTANKGVILVGKNTTAFQPRAMRYSDTAVVSYDRTDTFFVASSGSKYSCLDVESDGDAAVGGRVGSTGSTSAFITMLTGAGAGVSTGNANGTDIFRMKIRNATEAHALASSTSGTRLCRITRSSASIATITGAEANGYTDLSEIASPNVLVVSGGTDSSRFFNPNTLVATGGSFFGGYTQLATVGSSVVGVRGRDGSAEVMLTDGLNNNALSDFRFVGSPTRNFLHSVQLPDGSVAMISRESGAGDGRIVAVRYNAAGNLMYAKSFGFGDQNVPIPSGSAAIGFPDGSVAYAQRLDLNTWGFAKISSAGVVKSAAFTYLDANLNPAQLAALPDGSTAVISQGANAQLNYRRVSANAVVTFNHTYPDLVGYNYQDIAPIVVLANGAMVVAARMSDATVKFRTINPDTGGAGTIQALGTSCKAVRMDRDQSGNLVLAYDDSGLKLERRSGADISVVMNSATGGLTDKVIDVEVGPNGNTVVLCQQTGDDQLKFFGPAGFPSIATGTFPTTISVARDLDISAGNIAYIVADEQVGSTLNTYAARYLATGVRSAQRRTAGRKTGRVHAGASGVWLTGEVGTRKKGVGPFAARYSL